MMWWTHLLLRLEMRTQATVIWTEIVIRIMYLDYNIIEFGHVYDFSSIR